MRKISDNADVQLHYEHCLANGCSEKLAELLAFQEPPCVIGTNDQFWRGRLERVAEDETLQKLAARDAARGVDVKGKVFVGSLADSPRDTRDCWVSDQHEAIEKAKAKGMTVSNRGQVVYRPPEGTYDPGPPKPYAVADDIVTEEAITIMRKNRGASFKEVKAHVAKQCAESPDYKHAEAKLAESLTRALGDGGGTP